MLTGTGNGQADGADELRQRARDFLLGHDPATLPRLDFLRARWRSASTPSALGVSSAPPGPAGPTGPSAVSIAGRPPRR